jgi:hypothetical protein
MTVQQLHLFRSKRQRGVQAPPALEFATHCMLADTLRRWAMPNWVWTHLPFGERRDEVTGARLKRMGVMPGWPDLIFIPPKGHPTQRPHFLELKRRGAKLTEPQAGFALWCKLNDCPHEVANSYAAAVKVLQQWGALQTGVRVQ